MQATLGGCRDPVSISVNGYGTNTSYGANCEVVSSEASYRANVCNDEFVGHFAVERTFSEASSREAVEAFVRANCYGG